LIVAWGLPRPARAHSTSRRRPPRAALATCAQNAARRRH